MAKNGRIAVVVGTRPEIIKMSSIIRRLEKEHSDYFILHTGQHYSHFMDGQFFRDLQLPQPRYKFSRPVSIGANRHFELVRWMEARIKEALEKEKPAALLVQGDTDTVLAGASVASALGGITVGHVEAGLRSYDTEMPEERNRVEADKLSDVLFAPTHGARQNLIKEKLEHKRIEVTGNTIVDALFENLEIAERRGKNARQGGYALVTMHRPESVDDEDRLLKVIRALERLAKEKWLKIVFPLHPRTKQRLKEFGISLNDSFEVVDPPMGFLDFIRCEKNAAIILTDSGGVQEEACILRTPCVTLRTTTERPETVEAGGNVVAGYEPDCIVSSAIGMMEKSKDWPNPFGDGRASERILAVTREMIA